MTNGHIFEIYTIVAEIDDGMNLFFGLKNMTETEGMLNTRTGEHDFIGRSIPVYPQNDLDVPVGKQVLIKIKASLVKSFQVESRPNFLVVKRFSP